MRLITGKSSDFLFLPFAQFSGLLMKTKIVNAGLIGKTPTDESRKTRWEIAVRVRRTIIGFIFFRFLFLDFNETIIVHK